MVLTIITIGFNGFFNFAVFACFCLACMLLIFLQISIVVLRASIVCVFVRFFATCEANITCVY